MNNISPLTGQPHNVRYVALWLPRRDEFQRARSLGLVSARTPGELEELVEASQKQIAADLPGAQVAVHRWHVDRVVRAMLHLGQPNTPDGRAATYVWLAGHTGEIPTEPLK